MSAHVVTTLRRNGRDHLRLAWDAYQGHPFLDLRIFFDDAGELKPSRKGVTIRPDQLRQLIGALQSAELVGRQMGIVTSEAD